MDPQKRQGRNICTAVIHQVCAKYCSFFKKKLAWVSVTVLISIENVKIDYNYQQNLRPKILNIK